MAAVDLIQGNLKILFFRMETQTRLGALGPEVWKKATVRRTKQRKGQNHIRSPDGSGLRAAFHEVFAVLGTSSP